MPTDFAQQAQEILRDGSQFQWYVIPLMAIVFYIYTHEIQHRNWNVVLAGLAFWGADWINGILDLDRFEHRDYVYVLLCGSGLVENAIAR
jgi:hypothetical protein